MNEAARPLYLDNPKRPYSWTGELDATLPSKITHSKTWNLSKTNSFKGLRDRPDETYKDAKGQEWTRKPHFKGHLIRKHRGGSSPILLVDKLPHYLRNESTGDNNENETELPYSASRRVVDTPSRNETGGIADKKRSKFPKLQRKGSPPLMTSHDDFEYFSLSKPPPGLSRPVQIFPSKEKKEKVRKKEKEHVAKPKQTSVIVDAKREHEKGEKCRDCMTRIPYATLIATLLCCVGVGVFCGTMYRGTTLTLLMFDEVFRIKIQWDHEFRVEPVQLTFMIVGAAMGALGLMILFLGCLSTGSTRSKVYKTWRGRVGGRVSCAIFMGITYLLSIIWLLIFCALVIATVFYSLAWLQCKYIPENQCIDYNQFEFLFPSSTTEEDRRVCPEERKMFCKDCVNNAEVMFILATVAAFLVILSLIHYLMCLSANYAHIKDQEKFIDLQEIQYLQESEMSTLPKDRF